MDAGRRRRRGQARRPGRPGRCCAGPCGCCGPTGARSSSPPCSSSVWTVTVLAGPLLVRYGIDHGIKADDAGALNLAVIAYVGRRRHGLRRSTASRSSRSPSSARTSCATCGSGCSPTCSGCRMPFYDREKAGVIVSRMTSDVDSLSELVQMGLLMFVSNALLLVVVGRSSWAWCRGSSCWCALLALPPVVVGQHQVPARLQHAPTSTSATASARRCPTSRRASAGVRVIQAFAREDVEVRRFAAPQPAALRRPHAVGEDLGLVPAGHRVRRAWRPPPPRSVSAAGWCPHR